MLALKTRLPPLSQFFPPVFGTEDCYLFPGDGCRFPSANRKVTSMVLRPVVIIGQRRIVFEVPTALGRCSIHTFVVLALTVPIRSESVGSGRTTDRLS